MAERDEHLSGKLAHKYGVTAKNASSGSLQHYAPIKISISQCARHLGYEDVDSGNRAILANAAAGHGILKGQVKHAGLALQ